MFEGKPPFAAGAHGSESQAQSGEDLRALSWSDLVAKLGAARDLRRALGEMRSRENDDGTPASFDAHSAQLLATQLGDTGTKARIQVRMQLRRGR